MSEGKLPLRYLPLAWLGLILAIISFIILSAYAEGDLIPITERMGC